MKAFRILTTVFSLGVILIFSGCGGKNTPAESIPDKQLRLLSQTWKVSSVTLNDIPQTNWTGFQLTITGTSGGTFNYSCTGRPTLSPWPASGTWKFGADPVTQIIRDPGAAGTATTGAELTMTYTVTETTLQNLNFIYTGTGYSRVSNVSGNWVFNFTK